MASSDTQTAANRFRFLAEAAAWRYRNQGLIVHRSVRNQLMRDPVYREILALSDFPPHGLVLELGCGRGLLLSLLVCASNLGMLPGGRSGKHRWVGIEGNGELAETARLALANEAEIMTGDLRLETLPTCRLVLMLDILLRLQPAEQEALLERAVQALEPGGLIVLRETDAGPGWRQAVISLTQKAHGLLNRECRRPLYPRSAVAWTKQLESLSLAVVAKPLPAPFAKTLFVARKAVD
ncbi:MAG: class I SAM-dependent methyltransferase [Methylococcaceae bacterium]|nr:class I SAM-dependent methyltransferase [Methylococcaceae bacterium]